MSPSVPAADRASRPEKVTAFVSRSAIEHAAGADELSAFSSETPETAAAAQPAARPRIARGFTIASLVTATIALAAAAVIFLPTLGQLTQFQGPTLRPGRVTIGTTPLGADVTIDGQPHGLTPMTVQLNPGPHMVVLRLGAVERTIALQLNSGAEVTQHYEFASDASSPGVSTLSITTDPPGARVLIDGEARGTSPLTVTDLLATRHKVTVVGESGSAERQVATEEGIASSVVFSLPKAPSVSAGWLAVASPFEVQVIERGEVIGTSASPRFMVPAGTHETDFVNAALGYSEHRRIEVGQGGTATIKIDARAPISANARPWAEVLVDGRAVGQTPIANLAVALGAHQIIFRHPELGERQQNIVVTAKGPNRIAVDLTK